MNCPYPRRCYKCGKMDHIGRFCRTATKPRQVVNFLEENATGLEGSVSLNEKKPSSIAASISSGSQQELCVSNRYALLQDEGGNFIGNNDTEEVYMCHENANTSRRQKYRESYGKQRSNHSEEDLIDAQVSFIEGNGTNPLHLDSRVKHDEMTNKPVVKVRLNGKQVLSLMESGATCNIIDKELVYCLNMKTDIQIKPSECTIACANKSAMENYLSLIHI